MQRYISVQSTLLIFLMAVSIQGTTTRAIGGNVETTSLRGKFDGALHIFKERKESELAVEVVTETELVPKITTEPERVLQDVPPWPACEVGATACQDCKGIITAENPDLYVEIIAYGTMVTMDYRDDRVRIFCQIEDNLVASPPFIG